MRLLLSVVMIGLMFATPAGACDFKSASGSIIRFETDDKPTFDMSTGALSGYVVIDGKKCAYDDSTFTCEGHKTSFTGGDGRPLIWKGIEYTSTDQCYVGPE